MASECRFSVEDRAINKVVVDKAIELVGRSSNSEMEHGYLPHGMASRVGRKVGTSLMSHVYKASSKGIQVAAHNP